MITFEITICEKCNKFCFCDYCNLPNYDDRRQIELDNKLDESIQLLLTIHDKLNIPHEFILGGIGEPGLCTENKLQYILDKLPISMLSTTGDILKYSIDLPTSLHIAIPEDEYLAKQYAGKAKIWTIFSSIQDSNRYTSEVYDAIYLEGDPLTKQFDYSMLDLPYPNLVKPDISIIEKDRMVCRNYTPYITINLTRHTIAMCSCYNSYIQIPLTYENLVAVLTTSIFAKNTENCSYCFRNCFGLYALHSQYLQQRLKLKQLFGG